MSELKAIDTVWNGYRFRSRLEARWAVFFTELGVKWQYEAEGYDLDGTWYLPDFFLPEHDCFVEVKPTEFNLEEKTKASKLVLSSKKLLIKAIGPPDMQPFKAIQYIHGLHEASNCHVFLNKNSLQIDEYYQFGHTSDGLGKLERIPGFRDAVHASRGERF